jgi:hypothetical protein
MMDRPLFAIDAPGTPGTRCAGEHASSMPWNWFIITASRLYAKGLLKYKISYAETLWNSSATNFAQ